MPRQFTQHDWAEPDLFLCADESLVESAEGAKFRICPMEKEPQPVLQFTEPWEGGDGKIPSVISQDPPMGTVLYSPDDGRFHAWYATANRLLYSCSDPALGAGPAAGRFRAEGSGVCYATSHDGLQWDKPVVGTVLFQQSYRNNMVRVAVPPVSSDHLSGVVPNFLDGAASRLVGTIYSDFPDPVYPRGITVMFSDDGIEWQPHFPPTLPLDGDAHCLMWDSRQRCYLCTTRSAQHVHMLSRLRARPEFAHLKTKRHVALARSRDLIHWTPMLDVLEADEKDAANAELYLMYILPYGHAYLGFVQLFYPSANMTYGPLEMQLAISTDLLNWRRVGDRSPILPRGNPQAWDQSHVTLCTNPPFPQGNRMRFWYGGKDTEHWQAGRAAMGSATLRRDGFACWEAGPQGGTVTTRPMNLHWATWPFLNVDATHGEARMEILAEDGKPIPGCAMDDCLPITGDHVRAMVTFREGRGNFIRYSGRARIRFHLRNARLYAFKAPNVTG